MATLSKRPYDRRIFSVDLSPALRTGDTISRVRGITVEEEGGDTSLMITDVTLAGAVVSFLASGGEADLHYQLLIRFIVETTPEQQCESVVWVVVE